MKVILIIAASATLAACSPPQNQTNQTQAAANTVAPPAKKEVSDFEGYPTTQPNGSALTADYCVKVGDEPGSLFGNTKSCLLIACDKGDKASCKLAETYNGNLWPEGVPPDENSEAASNEAQ
jgi:hypothetical protein